MVHGKYRTARQKIVAEQLGVNESEIKNESSFVDDLGADSLDTVELVMASKKNSSARSPDEEAEKITTVQQAIDYVKPTSRSKIPGARALTRQKRRSCRCRPWRCHSGRRSAIPLPKPGDAIAMGVPASVRSPVSTPLPFRPHRRRGEGVRRVGAYLSPKEARRMDVTFIHYGLAAGIQAIRDSGIEVTEPTPTASVHQYRFGDRRPADDRGIPTTISSVVARARFRPSSFLAPSST